MFDSVFTSMGLALHALLIIILILVLAAFEFFFPAQRGQPWRERGRNIAFTAILLLVGGTAASMLVRLLPLPDPVRSAPVLSLPLVLAALFFGDLLFYLYHRAEHELPWLWRIHELHHSDAHLNATSSMRTHWLEYPVQSLAITVPVALTLGLTRAESFATALAGLFMLFFTHANIRLSFGRFSWLLCGPQLHRVHHSVLPEDRDCNFAQIFPMIDVLFRTYRAPSPNHYPKTGTEHLRSDVAILAASLGPLRRET